MKSLSIVLCALAGATCCAAPIEVRLMPGDGIPMRRDIIGVNHLAYGCDGYGLLLHKTHQVDPDLVALQREIGFGSLRYPGGCGGTHNFDWQKNAGLKGPCSVLGVVPFLEMCAAVGAQPMLGLSSHRGTPEEAAAYVEFLNAPADAAHPWALKRQAAGHPQPFAARFFEYGNETYHGTHARPGVPRRRITPESYATNYLAFRAAMRAVDPQVQLGLVLTAEGSGWNRRVLDLAGSSADFFIRHTYCGVPVRTTDADYLALFVDRQNSLRHLIDAECKEIGRPDARLAITEFNATISDYRTLSAGLVNLETLMEFAAEPRVMAANYWQFVNEAFGMVRGKTGSFVMRPNALAFKLFAATTQDVILPCEVVDADLDKIPVPQPDPEIVARMGTNFAAHIVFSYPGVKGRRSSATATHYELHPDGTHELVFEENRAMNFYHLQARIKGLPKGDRCSWRISCKMKVEDMSNEDVSLEVVDGRGWLATHSAVGLPAVFSPDWIPVSVVYHPLKDNPGSLILRFRRDGGASPGRVYVRDICVEPVLKEVVHASPLLTQVSRDRSDRKLGVMLINRSLVPHEVVLDAKRPIGTVQATALVGPDAYATNETDPQNVKLVELPTRSEGSTLRLTLPAHAAAGLLLR